MSKLFQVDPQMQALIQQQAQAQAQPQQQQQSPQQQQPGPTSPQDQFNPDYYLNYYINHFLSTKEGDSVIKSLEKKLPDLYDSLTQAVKVHKEITKKGNNNNKKVALDNEHALFPANQVPSQSLPNDTQPLNPNQIFNRGFDPSKLTG